MDQFKEIATRLWNSHFNKSNLSLFYLLSFYLLLIFNGVLDSEEKLKREKNVRKSMRREKEVRNRVDL
jgi:hypothetical protein